MKLEELEQGAATVKKLGLTFSVTGDDALALLEVAKAAKAYHKAEAAIRWNWQHSSVGERVDMKMAAKQAAKQLKAALDRLEGGQ